MLKEEIQQLSKALHEETVANRRHIHAHPELSFKEVETAAFIKKKLANLEISYQAKANTGIVALLEGTLCPSDKVVALRADIDALPIEETNEVVYKSQNKRVMHACGHDAHTASLLAVAAILSRLKDRFAGTVKFIFQPAEERIPGGARRMIAEGALALPVPQAVIGQHVMPELPAGSVGFRSGNYMASSDELYITIKGKGGHGAMPHLNIDSVAIACQIITALQQLVSRKADPLVPTVLSFGKFIANGAANVIPDEVYLEGTFRTLDESWRQDAHQKIQQMVVTIAEAMGATCDFELKKGYPVLVNEETLTRTMRSHAEDFLGKDKVIDLDVWMAAEDFAYYGQVCPACFYRLGTGNKKKNIDSALHTSTFDVDEMALETGPALMAYLALKILDT